MIIDLRSDTVTQPTPGMREAMMNASLGDDVFEEDPTVNALEEKAAALFGMESALFCPSGTMTNQIAIRIHTKPGDEVICDRLSHIYNYEGGGIAHNSGASVRLLEGDLGRFTAADVVANINPDNVHFPVSTLVSVENTSNKGGGVCWNFHQLKEISQACKAHGLTFHMDGARIFNAMVRQEESPEQYGAIFDTISVCLSKGLGAPVGSLLLGTKNHIKHARRIRKVFGGGMRQAGFLAAAGIYALDHQVERLKEDHALAQKIGEMLREKAFVKQLFPIETNIVVFELQEQYPQDEFMHQLEANGVRAVPFGPQLVRMTTHHDLNPNMLDRLDEVLQAMQ